MYINICVTSRIYYIRQNTKANKIIHTIHYQKVFYHLYNHCPIFLKAEKFLLILCMIS